MMRIKLMSSSFVFAFIGLLTIPTVGEEFTPEKLVDRAEIVFFSLEPGQQTVKRLLKLSELHDRIGATELAKSRYQSALETAHKEPSKHLKSDAFKALVAYHNRRGEIREAYDMILESPVLDRLIMANQMWHAEAEHGNWKKAITYAEEIAADEFYGRHWDLTRSLSSIFVSLHKRGMTDEAHQIVTRDLGTKKETAELQCRCFEGLARYHWQNGDKKLAAESQQRAVEALEEAGDSKSWQYHYKMIAKLVYEDKLDRDYIDKLLKLENDGLLVMENQQSFERYLASTLQMHRQIELLEYLLTKIDDTEMQSLAALHLPHAYLSAGQFEKSIETLKSWDSNTNLFGYGTGIAQQRYLASNYDQASQILEVVAPAVDRLQQSQEKPCVKERFSLQYEQLKFRNDAMQNKRVQFPEGTDSEQRFTCLIELADKLLSDQSK